MRSSRRRRFGALLVALLAGSLVAADTLPSRAQGFGWFGGLLGGGTPERSPSSPGYRSGGGGYFGGSNGEGYRRPSGDDDGASRRRAQRRKRPAAPPQDTAAAPKQAPAKTEAKVFVDVYGDTFALLLANGLDEALADRPDVAIVRKARGPSGIVNTSYYDWPKSIDEQLKSGKGKSEKKTEAPKGEKNKDAAKEGSGQAGSAKADATEKDAGKKDEKPDGKAREKIDVAVMMIGSNDRQPLTQDGKTYQRGSDEWTAIYRKRAIAIAEAFQKHKVPLIWVGLPIAKDDEFADDMAVFNEIYKDAAAKTGATYVDSWEVFSDDKGEFSPVGPDINGQTARLRTPDGIFFTVAGARKLAHFVETHLRRDIDGKLPAPQLPTGETPVAGAKPGDTGKTGDKAKGSGKAPSVAMVKPEAGPIKNLSESPSAKDGLLMQMPVAVGQGDATETAGKADGVPANRADNFRWSEPPKAPAK